MINLKYLFAVLLQILFVLPLGAQVTKTVYISMPGKLSSLITPEELKTVTNLILVGRIDQKDFETMRDCMPVLSNLDLEATTVISNSLDYNANVIPGYAFSSNDGNFRGKTSLKSIKLPFTVTSIEFSAFSGCTSLTKVTFPSTLKNIGNYAFDGCVNLTDVVFPDALSSIGDCAFYGCSSLTNITLPKSLSMLGDDTFYGCSAATCKIKATTPPFMHSGSLDKRVVAIYVPDGAGDLYQSAFYWNRKAIVEGDGNALRLNIEKAGTLASEIFAAGVVLNKVNSLILEGKLDKNDFYVIKSHMPNLVSINLSAVKMLTIPDSLFINKKLLNIDLPLSLVSIGNCAFKNCRGLKQLNFPSTLTIIGKEAFADCACLTKITLPAKITKINSSAFKNCCGISEIKNFNSVPQIILDNVWEGIDRTSCKLIVPENSSTVYMTNKVWSKFSEVVEQRIESEYVLIVIKNVGGVVVCENNTLLSGQAITVPAGEVLTFNISPKKGYHIGKVIFNDKDVTGLLQNGNFKTNSVNNSATLSVLFVKDLDVQLV